MPVYDFAHRREREEWVPRVAAGGVRCARCCLPIGSGERWQLDHDDGGRPRLAVAVGRSWPAHARCNESAGGAKGNDRRRRGNPRSREWY